MGLRDQCVADAGERAKALGGWPLVRLRSGRLEAVELEFVEDSGAGLL